MQTLAGVVEKIIFSIYVEPVSWQTLPSSSYRYHSGHIILQTCYLALFTIVYKVNIVPAIDINPVILSYKPATWLSLQ